MTRHESRAYEVGKKSRQMGNRLPKGKTYYQLHPKHQKRMSAYRKGWKAMDAILLGTMGETK